jgi:hypothetical protein
LKRSAVRSQKKDARLKKLEGMLESTSKHSSDGNAGLTAIAAQTVQDRKGEDPLSAETVIEVWFAEVDEEPPV